MMLNHFPSVDTSYSALIVTVFVMFIIAVVLFLNTSKNLFKRTGERRYGHPLNTEDFVRPISRAVDAAWPSG